MIENDILPTPGAFERISCIPGFLEDIRGRVHFIMGCRYVIENHEEMMVFAQMLIYKHGREICLTCPAFHVLIGSTTTIGYHGAIEDFQGIDSIKTFLASLTDRCEEK